MFFPRPDYPRPQWRRTIWQPLNGVWDFALDDSDLGVDAGWATRSAWPRRICVPFAFESAASGIGDRSVHECVWYHRTFPAPPVPEGGALRLHFGAVDYETTVWLNGHKLGTHRGGHVPFCFDIAPYVTAGDNRLVVRAFDAAHGGQPRGKQLWTGGPDEVFYHRTTGIWQAVWLEPVGRVALDRVEAVFERKPNRLLVRPSVRLPDDISAVALTVELRRHGRVIGARTWDRVERDADLTLELPESLDLWTPESPALYDVRWTLEAAGADADRVTSELGFRTVERDGDRMLLNGEPYVQRLVLDQGYYPHGYYTPPSVAAMRADVATIKALGFNGLRKHQKIEDPWFLTWCDRLGLLVWEEMPSAMLWSPGLCDALLGEFEQAIQRDFLHPCIVAWVPYNESWGVLQLRNEPEQLGDVVRAYDTLKRRDPSRLVVANSGFFQSVTDICDPHDYEQDPATLEANLACYAGRNPRPTMPAFGDVPVFVAGHEYAGQPVIVSEYGGTGFAVAPPAEGRDAFMYGTATSKDEFLHRVAGLTAAVREAPRSRGFCYTQLYDVEWEINGLLTFDRRPKASIERLRDIFQAPGEAESD